MTLSANSCALYRCEFSGNTPTTTPLLLADSRQANESTTDSTTFYSDRCGYRFSVLWILNCFASCGMLVASKKPLACYCLCIARHHLCPSGSTASRLPGVLAGPPLDSCCACMHRENAVVCTLEGDDAFSAPPPCSNSTAEPLTATEEELFLSFSDAWIAEATMVRTSFQDALLYPSTHLSLASS